jgi:hypothetical protein
VIAMKLRRPKIAGYVVACVSLLIFPSLSFGQARPAICNELEGGTVIASDGTYLGKITNGFSGDSIFNKFGTFGNKFSTKSIWNTYGNYGSPYATGSAMNPYSSDGPLVYVNGRPLARLSKNKNATGAIDPLIFGIVCFGYEPQ